VIGRNEGERLRRCLQSLPPPDGRSVYVDSASSDGSAALARSLGYPVVELDPARPFNQARARNSGLEFLVHHVPELEFVQFLDGDCTLDPQWLARGLAALQSWPDLAAVFGRRRERFPERTIYNTLCDLEWAGAGGAVHSFGGDALMRVSAFRQVGGFNPTIVSGDEPELCLRLRRVGWNTLRLDAEMTLHDADMHHFGEWWRRMVRAGHGYTEGAWRYGLGPEHHWLREALSLWAWGAALPLSALALAPRSLAVLLAYPLLAARIYRRLRARDYTPRQAALYAASCVIGKFPQVQGGLTFFQRRVGLAGSGPMEYRAP
jgi:glycosyltransferase involved in cell wall biosynthesis